ARPYCGPAVSGPAWSAGPGYYIRPPGHHRPAVKVARSHGMHEDFVAKLVGQHEISMRINCSSAGARPHFGDGINVPLDHRTAVDVASTMSHHPDMARSREQQVAGPVSHDGTSRQCERLSQSAVMAAVTYHRPDWSRHEICPATDFPH